MATLKISSDLQNVIKKVVLDTYFPVGSLYLTVGSENPNNTIGGTWTKLSGYYLYADTSINNTSYTGKGTQGHSITKAQLPNYTLYNSSHDHKTTTDLGSNGLVLNWNNQQSGSDYWGAQYQSDSFKSSGGIVLNSLRTNSTTIKVNSGGSNQAHSHNIATKGIYVWQRTK